MVGAGAGQGSGDKVGAGECLGLASNADLWKKEEREKDMKMGTHWRVATDWRRREMSIHLRPGHSQTVHQRPDQPEEQTKL